MERRSGNKSQIIEECFLEVNACQRLPVKRSLDSVEREKKQVRTKSAGARYGNSPPMNACSSSSCMLMPMPSGICIPTPTGAPFSGHS